MVSKQHGKYIIASQDPRLHRLVRMHAQRDKFLHDCTRNYQLIVKSNIHDGKGYATFEIVLGGLIMRVVLSLHLVAVNVFAVVSCCSCCLLFSSMSKHIIKECALCNRINDIVIVFALLFLSHGAVPGRRHRQIPVS